MIPIMASQPAQPRTTTSSSLPDEVITCLQNARFLHLATSSNNTPHISLMNYTYLSSTPFSSFPTIIMTTPPSSRKTLNLAANPQVSLLVHDWISHRPPTLGSQHSSGGDRRSPSPPPAAASSGARPNPRSGSLAELLLGMNTASLSRISATINGTARLVPEGSEEEKWCRERHLANNTFSPSSTSADQMNSAGVQEDLLASSPPVAGLWGAEEKEGDAEQEEGDGGTKCYVQGEEVKVVAVRIRDGRVADWKGRVRDWAVREGDGGGMVNGV